MKISRIKKMSRKIIKGSVMKSARLILFLTAGIVIFSLLPFAADIFMGKHPAAVLAASVMILILGAVYFSSFRMGSGAWFLFYNRKKRGAKTAFWFRPSRSFKSMLMYAALFMRKILWLSVFASPGAVLIAMAVLTAMNGGVEFNLFATWIAGGTVLLLTGFAFLYFFNQRYFLVPYLRAADPSAKSREIFRKSREYMNKNIRTAALMKMSFLPWFAVCVTVVPLFYVWTYYSQSCAVMAEEIILKKEKAV